MGKKKKFIDKKKSSTFQLMSRDSSDPNYSVDPSGDRVFVRIDGNPHSGNTFFDDGEDGGGEVNYSDPDGRFADAPGDDDSEEELSFGGQAPRQPAGKQQLPDHIRKEILQLGFPDDGYNYLLHLRDIKERGGGSYFYQNPKAKLDQLHPDVKAYDASRIKISKVKDESYENSIYGVASKTVAVRLQKAVDPDVAAFLDSDLSEFGSDVEELEEDFVFNGNLPEGPEDIEFDKKLSLVEDPEVSRELTACSLDNVADFSASDEVRNDSLNGMDMGNLEPRVRRPLDDQFDLLEHQEYGTDGEDEYTEVESEENEYQESLTEKLSHALKGRVVDDFEKVGKYTAPSDLLHDNKMAKDPVLLESAADVIHRCIEYAEKYGNEDENEDVVILEESSDESELWDCETVVSLYSNLDNHPGKIDAPETRRKKKLAETVSGALGAPTHVISLKGKERLPVDFLPKSQASATGKVKDKVKLRNESQRRTPISQESKEEKKERKAAVKEERREARRAKKELKELYKNEAHNAQKVAAFTGPSTIHLS